MNSVELSHVLNRKQTLCTNDAGKSGEINSSRYGKLSSVVQMHKTDPVHNSHDTAVRQRVKYSAHEGVGVKKRPSVKDVAIIK